VCEDGGRAAALERAGGSELPPAGQVCGRPGGFRVQEKVSVRFVEGFVERAGRLNVGNGLEPGVDMGPLAHDRRIKAMESLMEDSKRAGGTVRIGGSRSNRKGYFFEPTVLTDLSDDSKAMTEEPFGPVALMRPFKDYDEAVHVANRLPFGLAAYAFTRDSRRATRLGDDIESGMVGINTFRINVPESPFGGIKQSGHGSEEGIEGLDSCLITKFVSEA